MLWVRRRMGWRSAVDLVVANPEQPASEPVPADAPEIAVPAVVGLIYGDAALKLQDAGFQVRPFYSNTTDKPQGQVVAQKPKGGSKAQKGTVVEITISVSDQPNAELPGTDAPEQP